MVDNNKANWTFDTDGKCLSVSTYRTDDVNDIDYMGVPNQFDSCDICLLQKLKHCEKDVDQTWDTYVSQRDAALAVTNNTRSFFWLGRCYEVDPTAPKVAPSVVTAAHGGSNTNWSNIAGTTSTLATCCDCYIYAGKYEYEGATWDGSAPVTSMVVDVSTLVICNGSGEVVPWEGERPETIFLHQDGEDWYGEYTAGGITFAIQISYTEMDTVAHTGSFIMWVSTDYGTAYIATKGGTSPVGTYNVACLTNGRFTCPTNFNNVKTLVAA